MKNKIYILALILFSTFAACSDEAVDKKNSIFDDEANPQRTEFDKWVLTNLTRPYNIDFLYRYDDVEADPSFNLAPAKLENSQLLAQILKYAWLEAYDEAVGVDFTRQYGPRVIMFVGSPAYESNTEVIATAEGGLKVTLYRVNLLELTDGYMNRYYFHVMHHEFCHILHQTKNYSIDFPKISERYADTGYMAGDWITYDASSNTRIEARGNGFVSPYAASEANEDFAEVFSIYITSSDEVWNGILNDAAKKSHTDAGGKVGATGKTLILEKLEFVKLFTASSWGFDLDELRLNLARRTKKIKSMEFIEFKN